MPRHNVFRFQAWLLTLAFFLGLSGVPAAFAHAAEQGKVVKKKQVVRASSASRASNKRAVASRDTKASRVRVTLRKDSGPMVKKRQVVRRATRKPLVQPGAKVALAAASQPDSTASATLQVSDASTAKTDDPVFLRSGSALVVDENTDQVLLAKNADIQRPIASLTKLMTAAVILDAHLPMDQVIEITDADIDTLKWSSSRLRPGTKLTREELLKLALMSSENRAAHALGRTYPGGLPAFVEAMNRKAQSLGMQSTHYVEPTGLSPQNESTAHDLALLVKAAYHYPTIRAFSTHPESEVEVGRRTLQYRNTDHLVFNRGWDILLQKTGYINEAGHCLVLQTLFEGRRVIVVLLDAWGKYSHFGDAERIRTWLEAKGLRNLPQTSRTEEARGDDQTRLMRTALVDRRPVAPALGD